MRRVRVRDVAVDQLPDELPVRGLVARFGGTYRDARDAMTVMELRGSQVHKGDGSSIRQLDLERLRAGLRGERKAARVGRAHAPSPESLALSSQSRAARPVSSSNPLRPLSSKKFDEKPTWA